MKTPSPSAVKSMMYRTNKLGEFKFWSSFRRVTEAKWTDKKIVYNNSDIAHFRLDMEYNLFDLPFSSFINETIISKSKKDFANRNQTCYETDPSNFYVDS